MTPLTSTIALVGPIYFTSYLVCVLGDSFISSDGTMDGREGSSTIDWGCTAGRGGHPSFSPPPDRAASKVGSCTSLKKSGNFEILCCRTAGVHSLGGSNLFYFVCVLGDSFILSDGTMDGREDSSAIDWGCTAGGGGTPLIFTTTRPRSK